MSDQAKELCIALMKADTEDDVIRILKEAGYWDKPEVWRYYGDSDMNYSTIGNQQSNPIPSLVEKIVNCIDTRLINACLEKGIDPEGSQAPQSMRHAVATFFGDGGLDAASIQNWSNNKRNMVARGITVAATGHNPKDGRPCFSIADCGEGQTPDNMPLTILSLNRKNKDNIPFVQGKFNMGGTGALVFCGSHNLQFILTRRNPALLPASAQLSDTQWGFTVVRRENPTGKRRSSVYSYMAPLGADGSHTTGGVLRFTADTMPIFPDGRNPYAKHSDHGTLIKLYEYYLKVSNIIRKDGLLMPLDLMLPDIPLPVRLHECRNYKGHEGSFDTNLNGLTVRLEDGRAENLEDDFPDSGSMTVMGENILFGIYAFKKGRADTYKKNEGIIFVVNGQTHARITRDFFRSTAVGLSHIADSILVVVDCSNLSGRSREDLFKNSRDRLNNGPLQAEIEKELQYLLKNHEGLRSLKDKRRREEIQAQFEDTKPIESILEKLVKNDPALSELFLAGDHIANPFRMLSAGPDNKPYKGRQHPSYFKFKGEQYGNVLSRGCHLNMRCRILFETDAENYYFKRDRDRGRFSLQILGKDGTPQPYDNGVFNLRNGIATLSLTLPEGTNVGESITFATQVDDDTLLNPFVNTFTVTAKEPAEIHEGGNGKNKPPGSPDKHKNKSVPSKISLPKIKLVSKEDWGAQSPPFDRFTALRAVYNGDGQGYDFYVNINNFHLELEMKKDMKSTTLLRNRFIYGQVLLGLAILNQDLQEKEKKDAAGESDVSREEGKGNIEDRLEAYARAAAPVILPIMRLGMLESEDIPAVDAFTEAV